MGNKSVESENDDIKPAQVAFGKIKSCFWTTDGKSWSPDERSRAYHYSITMGRLVSDNGIFHANARATVVYTAALS